MHTRAAVAATLRYLRLALLVGAAACADPSTPVSPDRPQPSGAPQLARARRTAPSAPQSVTAAPGGTATSVAVSWQAPASDGGSAIQSYRITSNPGAVTATVAGTQTSGTVSGLQTGQSYTFTVVAVNGIGSSPASNPSNAVTPGGTTTTNTPPTATITAPANGASYTQGASVTFTGAGSDAEDGALSGASLVWTSSINGQIGTGASFSTTALSAGTHTITLTAKDSKGAAGTATVTVTVSAPTTPPPSSTRWVAGAYVGYQRSQYPETSVDFTYMTHVIMAGVLPTATGGVDTTFYNDNVNGPRMARNLSARAHQFGRKALLMLGGAGARDNFASAASSTYRATFVSNLIKTMDALGYDGIDVDWEPISAADEPLVLQLVKDLRAQRPGMLISVPVNWVGAYSAVDPWYGQLAAVVDRINIMSYGMADNWGGWVSWHSAALAGEGADHPSSVSSSVRAYLAAGVPNGKLGLGVGTYGSCWQGVNGVLKPLSSTAGVKAGDNVMTYAAVMSSYFNSANYTWDATASMGYLSFAAPTGPQGCTLISYEDPQSVAAKGAWAKAQNLGGAIIWTIGEGHVPTAAAGSQDPLTKALYNAIQ